jgi:hypothetical protein
LKIAVFLISLICLTISTGSGLVLAQVQNSSEKNLGGGFLTGYWVDLFSLLQAVAAIGTTGAFIFIILQTRMTNYEINSTFRPWIGCKEILTETTTGKGIKINITLMENSLHPSKE